MFFFSIYLLIDEQLVLRTVGLIFCSFGFSSSDVVAVVVVVMVVGLSVGREQEFARQLELAKELSKKTREEEIQRQKELFEAFQTTTGAAVEEEEEEGASETRSGDQADSAADLPAHRFRYKLRAVCHHLGQRAYAGHYITDILRNGRKKSKDGENQKTTIWTRYDDQYVRRIPESTALGESSQSTCYVLFYLLDSADEVQKMMDKG